jgi:hypothetical protein
MIGETNRQFRGWQRGCGCFLIGCSLIVMLCLGGALAVVRGQMVGPAIDLQLGRYHVLSRTTTSPNCHPLSAGCVLTTQRLAHAAQAYYTISVLSVTEVQISGGVQEQLNTARLITLPIAP